MTVRITELRCIHLPPLRALIVRVDTDEGLYGLSQVEKSKSGYLAPQIGFCRDFIIGLDPRDVENVMRRIRRLGGFKPWGAAVSSIEIALWDIAGKAAGVPVHRLLGGKVRDAVRPYMGGPPPFTHWPTNGNRGDRPEDYGERAALRKEVANGMSFMKVAVGFHDDHWKEGGGHHYGVACPQAEPSPALGFSCGNLGQNAGMPTTKGLRQAIDCVTAVHEALGGEMGMAFDCGPGWKLPGAMSFARAVEHLEPMWLEDLLVGDYTPYVDADVYRELTTATTARIHTGEQIYLRQNFKQLIETRAADVIGPDPMDIGGIAELKWVAEYADLHGILMAPHGIGNGPFGLAALIQVCATLPDNFVAFELPHISPRWRPLIVGLEGELVEDGLIRVPDAPGLGTDLNEEAVRDFLGTDDIYLPLPA